jgi:glyoxylase-like metal-dependent hydrolase (beta-lactamase superfamily II)
MLFRILHDERSGELSYLLADSDAREAVVIDPHRRDLPVVQALLDELGLRLRWVLRTHQHDAVQPLEFDSLSRLRAPVVQGGVRFGAKKGLHGMQLAFGRETLTVLATPGHTPHCLSFMWRDRVFLGGLLVAEACAVQPVPEAPEALWDSVTQRIFTLPDETLLFSGHGRRARAVSTVMEQRRWHPLFAGGSRDACLSRLAALSARQAPKSLPPSLASIERLS